MTTIETAQTRRPRPLGSHRLKVRLLQILGLLAVLAAWASAPYAGTVSPLILPPPGQVAFRFVELLSEPWLWRATWVTTAEILVSFALATVVGVVVGFLLSRNKRVAVSVEPILAWGYIFPFALLYPMFVMWFGAGPESKVAYAFTNAVFPIAFNTMRGLSSVDQKYLAVGRAYRASKHQIDRHIKLGAAWPMILSGIRIGGGMVTVTVVLGEVLGSAAGLGFEIQQSVNTFQIVQAYALIVFLVGLSSLLLWAMERGLRSSRYS